MAEYNLEDDENYDEEMNQGPTDTETDASYFGADEGITSKDASRKSMLYGYLADKAAQRNQESYAQNMGLAGLSSAAAKMGSIQGEERKSGLGGMPESLYKAGEGDVGRQEKLQKLYSDLAARRGATEQRAEASQARAQQGAAMVQARQQQFGESSRHNQAMEGLKRQEIYAKGDKGPAEQWDIVKDVTGPNGEPMMVNKKTGETKIAELPSGFKMADKKLPEAARHEVDTLATKNANKVSIKNQISSYLGEFQQAQSADDKVRIGRQMLKVLNSTEGADAIGKEESERLGNALEFQIANVTGPGPFLGRDLEGFERQVASSLSAIDKGVKLNENRIDEISGKQPRHQVAGPQMNFGGQASGQATAASAPAFKPGDRRMKDGQMYERRADGTWVPVQGGM